MKIPLPLPNRRPQAYRFASMLILLAVLAAPIKAQTWNYVAMGDSLAFGLWAFPGNSYVSRFRNYVQTDNGVTVNLNNLGVNGWRSGDLLNALLTNTTYRNAVMNARVITWDIGGNDLLDARSSYKSGTCGGSDNQNCLRNALTSIRNNWTAIMHEILVLRGNNVMVRTIEMYNPYIVTDSNTNTWPNDGGINDYQAFKPYLDEFNNYIRTTATINGIETGRVFTAFNGVAGNEDPVGKGYISFDGLHPNDSGHGIIATHIRTAVVVPRVRTIEPYDFDGDGRTDVGVWRPSTGTWYYSSSENNSFNSLQWGSGALGDLIVPGDYDGDRKTDFAVFRPSNGTWYVLNSSNSTIRIQQWGMSGDRPAPGDYDADGKTDIAVFRHGNWYVLQSSNNGFLSQQFGTNGDEPVAGDYDGDGKTDFAVYRNGAQSVWYIRKSTNGVVVTQGWGVQGDKPAATDYDGDYKSDIAIWRPDTGGWYILKSTTGALISQQWGNQIYEDVAVPSDYDGDGKADIAVWRNSTGYWYISKSSDSSVGIQQFGSSGDLPAPARNP